MAFFDEIPEIKYEGKDSKNPLAFKFYDSEKIVLGKPMKEHLPFAMAWWHNLGANGVDMFGSGTADKSFGKTLGTMELAKAKVDAGIEFMKKLGIHYYCFHDVDLVPESDDINETNRRLDELSDYILEKTKGSDIKCLWGTANMFSNPRFMNGAGSTNSADVYCFAAAQVKKALDITVKLGGRGYVFWGGREGYETLLNTDVKLEQENIASLMRMAVEYGRSIGFDGDFYIEPKPKEPMKHQYDFDAATAIGFLRQYGLDKDFVLKRSNGLYTYIVPDIAYHYDKLVTRNFDKAINVLGADHHGYVPRLKAALTALGVDADKLDVVLMQMVMLVRDGEVVKLSKRSGKAITLVTLLDEIPIDAARFFFNLREANSQFEFDLDLAIEKSSQNPVYYVQYAHARICSLLRNLSEEGVEIPETADLDLLEVILLQVAYNSVDGLPDRICVITLVRNPLAYILRRAFLDAAHSDIVQGLESADRGGADRHKLAGIVPDPPQGIQSHAERLPVHRMSGYLGALDWQERARPDMEADIPDVNPFGPDFIHDAVSEMQSGRRSGHRASDSGV